MGIMQFIKKLRGELDSLERDIAFSELYDKIYAKIITEYAEQGDEYAYPWIEVLMTDESGGTYCIVSAGGKLWKYYYSYSNGEVTLTEPVEVQIAYPEVSSRTFTFRSSDGKLKYISISAASVLNRVGEIDSTKLFDSFEENFEKYSKDSYLQFYHIGRKMQFGTVAGLARLNNFLLVWGEIDESTPLGAVAERAFETGKWGISIGYMPLEEPETIEGNVKVYNRGYFVEHSVLLEEDAASYFTQIRSITKERKMEKNKLVDVLNEFGVSEDKIKEITEDVEVREREIQAKGLVTRDAEAETTKGTEGEAVTIELDENFNKLIQETVAQTVQAVLDKALPEIEQRFATLKEEVENYKASVTEQKEQTKVIVEDNSNLPAVRNRTVVVGYAPARANIAESANVEKEVGIGEVFARKVAK